MADVELVIKMPEEYYNEILTQGMDRSHLMPLYKALVNSTPLPKGHGRLIDADELKKEYPHDTDWDYPVSTNCYVVESIDNSPTILEAERDGK